MPYSFTQIEKDKSRTISAAFFFLVVIYFAATWVLALMFKNFWFFQRIFGGEDAIYQNATFQGLGWIGSFYITFWSFVIAGVHWFFASMGLVDRLNGILRARVPNVDDINEKMFQNIVEEVSVATGGMQIQPMIIPTMMLNACAYADGKAVPVIAITTGLLNKLNRSQIEAVVGHEAGHVVSEDCESTTIISAMFEIFGAALEAGRNIMEGASDGGHSSTRRNTGWRMGNDYPSRGDGDGRGIGAVIIFVLMIILIIWLINNLARLMRMFISRQREYRADAISTRLTRNPQALAEALYIIGNRRHSLSEGRDALQSMFIVNPRESSLDNQMDFVSDLFSTHPPLQERIKILLSMAHSTEDVLVSSLKNVTDQEESELQKRQEIFGKAQGGMWYVQTPANNWSGPHNLAAMMAFEWLNPQTPVRKMGENVTMPLNMIDSYMKSYEQTVKASPAFACPACSGKMVETIYEHVKILECQQCQGVLLKEESVSVILSRKDKTFDTRIQQMAQTLLNEKQLAVKDSTLSYESQRMYRCDQCQHNPRKMRRRLFNRYYPVEIDKCAMCGLVWFDKDELEVMQCMYEIRDAASKNTL